MRNEERFVAIEEYKYGAPFYSIRDKLNFVPTMRFLNAQDMYWVYEKLNSNQIVIGDNAEVTKAMAYSNLLKEETDNIKEELQIVFDEFIKDLKNKLYEGG